MRSGRWSTRLPGAGVGERPLQLWQEFARGPAAAGLPARLTAGHVATQPTVIDAPAGTTHVCSLPEDARASRPLRHCRACNKTKCGSWHFWRMRDWAPKELALAPSTEEKTWIMDLLTAVIMRVEPGSHGVKTNSSRRSG